MPAAEANVLTQRAERYLTQLCQHASHMGRRARHRAYDHDGELVPEVRNVEFSGAGGCITFDLGRCTLRATPDRLTLLAEAAEEADLERLERLLGRRLETIGRRDHLTVTWNRVRAPEHGAVGVPNRTGHAGVRHRRPSTVLLVAAIALAVAAHLGLVAGVLTSPLAGLAADAILALVVAKVVMATAFGLYHRRTRQGPAPKASGGGPPHRHAE